MRWRIGLGEDRGLGGSQVESVRAVAYLSIGYKNIPVSIDDAPKAVQGERNVVTTISARSAQRI